MGSNMQRQAVPLLTTEAPAVGTGIEAKAAVDSGVCVVAKNAGVVERSASNEIIIRRDSDGNRDVYHLTKFKRSNQSNCYNQKPIVYKNDHVEAGEVIADGPSTSNGEIALGKNPLIGFMTWEATTTRMRSCYPSAWFRKMSIPPSTLRSMRRKPRYQAGTGRDYPRCAGRGRGCPERPG